MYIPIKIEIKETNIKCIYSAYIKIKRMSKICSILSCSFYTFCLIIINMTILSSLSFYYISSLI